MSDDQGDGSAQDRGEWLDAVGELLFGRRLRLRVLLWVAEQKNAFHQSEAARGVGYNSSGEVAKELERLVQLGMLRKFGRPSRVGPQHYTVETEHVGWAVVDAADAMVDALSSGPRRTEPVLLGDVIESAPARRPRPVVHDDSAR